MSKGSQRRPTLITPEAEQIAWDLAYGKISKEEYWTKRKQLEAENKWYKH